MDDANLKKALENNISHFCKTGEVFLLTDLLGADEPIQQAADVKNLCLAPY